MLDGALSWSEKNRPHFLHTVFLYTDSLTFVYILKCYVKEFFKGKMKEKEQLAETDFFSYLLGWFPSVSLKNVKKKSLDPNVGNEN